MILDKFNVKVSILCSTRNCLPYVGQCMRSVIKQTYNHWEMIIVDDCSNDRTYKRAKEIAKKHDRIYVTQNKERLHCGGSYQKALSLATGDICCVLDGDDVLPYTSVERIVKYYLSYPDIDFIWTNHRWYNGDMTRYKSGISHIPRKSTIYESEENFRHVYSHWRTFRTDMKNKGSLFDPKLKCAVDKDLGYRLEELGKGGFVNEMMYYYRYHKTNMSHNSNQKSVWDAVRKKHKDCKRFDVVNLPIL